MLTSYVPRVYLMLTVCLAYVDLIFTLCRPYAYLLEDIQEWRLSSLQTFPAPDTCSTPFPSSFLPLNYSSFRCLSFPSSPSFPSPLTSFPPIFPSYSSFPPFVFSFTSIPHLHFSFILSIHLLHFLLSSSSLIPPPSSSFFLSLLCFLPPSFLLIPALPYLPLPSCS